MAKFVFSAFADEITSDFNGQLEALERLGIPLLELRGVDGQNFTLLDDRQIDEVHKKLSAHKIGLSALGSPIGKITTGDDFDAHLRLFERIMDIGERLACRRIRMFSFYRGEGMTDEAHEREVFSRIEKLLEKSEKRGFVLCHENEKDIYGDSPQNERKLLERFGGRLRAVLDCGNFAFCGMDASPSYALMKDYLEYMHIKDADENGVIVPPGLGVAGIRDTLAAIDRDFSGEIIITMEPHLMMFTGLDKLSKLDDIRHKYSFATPYEAFETAVDAVRDMLAHL